MIFKKWILCLSSSTASNKHTLRALGDQYGQSRGSLPWGLRSESVLEKIPWVLAWHVIGTTNLWVCPLIHLPSAFLVFLLCFSSIVSLISGTRGWAESSGVFRSIRAGLCCSMTVHTSNWSQVTSSHSQRWGGEGALHCPPQMRLTMWWFTLKVTRVRLIPSFFIHTRQATGTVNRQTFLVFSVGVELLDRLLCPFPN